MKFRIIHATHREKIFSLAGGFGRLGFLATDISLPAFAAIQADLQTPSAVSASLSLFLAGFAAAQLLWGPLSDRYGRKPVLISLTIFALVMKDLWLRRRYAAGIAFYFQAVDYLCAWLGYLAVRRRVHISQKVNRICDHHAAGGSISGTGSLLGSWLLVIFLTDFPYPVSPLPSNC